MPSSASRHDHFPRHDAARRAAIRAAVASLDAAWAIADTAPDGLLTAIAAQADAAPAAAIAALRPWLADRRWLAARIDSALALLRADPFARPPLRAFGGGEGSGGDAAPGGLVFAERDHVRLALRFWPRATRPPPAAPAVFVPGRAALHILASGGARLCLHQVAVAPAEEAGIFTARAAAPCQSDPPRPLQTGETLDLDTARESFTLTRPDGSDTGLILSQLFDVLDTPENQRQKGLSAELDAFPYVNGQLFAGRLRIPQFSEKMREHLLDAARHDWSGVSPAIFGSLFQSVMDAKERRAKGAHYTTEANILKVIGPLFLDDLNAELDRIAARRTGRDAALTDYLAKLKRLTFFDPACGCGNFLVIAYREIRALELRALRLRYPDGGMNAALMSQVTVDQFYGIEFEEFPARIAEVAMWMADHIANNWINEAFNTNIARIPLKGGATILHGDALETDWAELLPPEKCSYIMGNPPFIGAKFQSEFQRAQVRRIANLGGSGGTLDYVAAWFIKAGQYVNHIPSPLRERARDLARRSRA